MVENEIAIRPATAADIPDMVRLRRIMFEAMEEASPAELDTAEGVWASYFAEALPSQTFCGWLAVTPDGQVVSTCGVVIDRHPPTPHNLSGRIGYLMNVVTEPDYRRQGLARRIIQAALRWLDEQGIQRVTLHATESGQPLYQSLGFEPVTSEMRRTGSK